jgi:hypothetical protein
MTKLRFFDAAASCTVIFSILPSDSSPSTSTQQQVISPFDNTQGTRTDQQGRGTGRWIFLIAYLAFFRLFRNRAKLSDIPNLPVCFTQTARFGVIS